MIFTALYAIGMKLFRAGIALASPFDEKARLMHRGLAGVTGRLANYDNSQRCVWIHAASLGEFEQGRPIIEAVKAQYPDKRVVLTFFSPSGYEIRKNYNLADLVTYLPLDGPMTSERFVSTINPEVAIFVKYEFWHFYLRALARRRIPTYNISTIFRPQQMFFRPAGGWFRKMLGQFTHLYVQDEQSARLLEGIGLKNYTVAGDTRFDRVAKIAAQSAENATAKAFAEGARVIVAGSTWAPDEDLLTEYINTAPDDMKLILAPHEIDEAHIRQIVKKLKVSYSLITEAMADVNSKKVLIINTMGMLSGIYKYGEIAYIGGGFGKGIHNTLEAATYGMPVVFGTNYKRFKEACDLIECGAGFNINNYTELKNVLDNLWSDIPKLAEAKKSAGKYVESMCGATDKIMHDLFAAG